MIDGTGKHVTAGIIDEHSHIAISKGVNEGSASITSEVPMAPVADPRRVVGMDPAFRPPTSQPPWW